MIESGSHRNKTKKRWIPINPNIHLRNRTCRCKTLRLTETVAQQAFPVGRVLPEKAAIFQSRPVIRHEEGIERFGRLPEMSWLFSPFH